MSSSLSDAIKVIDEQNIDKERQYGRTIGIHAPHRKGKTITAIMLIDYYMDYYDYIKGVISNIHIFENYINKPYIPLQNIKMISEEEYRSYIILTDEIRTLVDARMSSSFKNMFISRLLADTGKFRQIHLLTDQDAGAVDKRVRLNADAVLKPSIDFDTGVCTVKVVPNYRTYFWLDAYNEWDRYDVEFYFDFRKYYDYYDTEEHVENYYLSFHPGELLEMFLKWFKKREYDKIEGYKIRKGTLDLWTEMNPGLYITDKQLRALLEYMKLETDLVFARGGKSKR